MSIKYCKEWFLELFNVDAKHHDFAEVLTNLGLESMAFDMSSLSDDRVIIAEVLSTKPHPDADRLKVCEVDIGESVLTIVCGCPSVAPGMKVPAATHGAKLPKLKIKRSKIRGVASEGMLCSAEDLGWSCYSSGLLALPQDAVVGDSFYRYFGVEESGIESEITPNRGDCLSLRGIVREFAAKTKQAYASLKVADVSVSKEHKFTLETSLCRAYTGAIISQLNQSEPSPKVLSKNYVMGIHSVSPVVDVLNYVTHEIGQPFHAFDLGLIQLPLIVKEADKSSIFMGIQGQEIKVECGDLVIVDQTGKVKALAGIMGSLDSAVTEDTQQIFLEAAHFCSRQIAKTLRRINLTTDSSFRFERGVDWDAVGDSMQRLLCVLQDNFDCNVDYFFSHDLPVDASKPIRFDSKYVKKMLGYDFSNEVIESTMTALGFKWQFDKPAWLVVPPGYRNDVNYPVDMLEEILRFQGYNQPDTEGSKFIKVPLSTDLNGSLSNDFSERLVSAGYNEMVSYSFISEEKYKLFSERDPIKLTNPMSEDLSVMRASLWPSLLMIAQRNLSRQHSYLRIFEASRVFYGCDADSQPRSIAGLLSGSSDADNWMKGVNSSCDFFQIKKDVENLLRHIPPSVIEWLPSKIKGLQDGVSALIKINGEVVGKCGMLCPHLMRQFGIVEPVGLFELSRLDVCEKNFNDALLIPSGFPSIRRDVTFDVPKTITYAQIQGVIDKNDKISLKCHSLFDIYSVNDCNRKDIKSLSIAMIFNHPEKTMKDEIANRYRDKLIEDLQSELNITVRGIHDHIDKG
ncbi:MAG TPA: phenylalanine--tRNA ligase subunit beta [Gammaproteobacteria bacterium]|nr:phenylalanine--tRNA ligase subunit beta [Gammaproteobacteria bacterium]